MKIIRTNSAAKKFGQGLSARYLGALRLRLGQRGPGSGDRAQSLGRAAQAGGLASRDLARMHEHALLRLANEADFSAHRNDSLRRAGVFFNQALIPLEAAQTASRLSHRRLQQKNRILSLHTASLALANRRLQREVVRRKAGEAAVFLAKTQYQQLFKDSQHMQRKLRQLTRQILVAQEDERKSISRELHDEVVQALVGINVQLAVLGEGAKHGQPNLRTNLARTRRIVEGSVQAVHRFAHELRPAMLDDLGLIPALHTYCKGLSARKNLKIILIASSGVEALDNTMRTIFYRVALEALTNVVRHAKATCVKVIISELPGVMQMEVSDNGKSFAAAKTMRVPNHRQLGLISMRERVEMVGGNFHLESTVGQGTVVRASLPFNRAKEKP